MRRFTLGLYMLVGLMGLTLCPDVAGQSTDAYPRSLSEQYGPDYYVPPLSPRSGRVYLAGTFGYFFAYDRDGAVNPDTGRRFENEFDAGEYFTGAVGYHVNRVRPELEVGFREADLAGVSPGGNGGGAGRVDNTTFMVNVYYDQPLADRLEGYIGGGIGAVHADVGLRYDPPLSFDGGATTIDRSHEDHWVMGYQFMIGAAYHVLDNLAITGGYRLQVIDDIELDQGLRLESELIHSVEVGLRLTF